MTILTPGLLRALPYALYNVKIAQRGVLFQWSARFLPFFGGRQHLRAPAENSVFATTGANAIQGSVVNAADPDGSLAQQAAGAFQRRPFCFKKDKPSP